MIRPASLALALSFAAAPALAADGAKLFALQCKTCHGATSTLMGPTLAGVAGADIASRPGFKYSPALTAKAGAWTDANLDAFLKAPATFAPGNRMMVGAPMLEPRTAIIAYLKTLK